MHVRFGILLGYPGVAIDAFVDTESRGESAGLADVFVAEGRFNSADVAFGVCEGDQAHTDVVRTVELWEAVLGLVQEQYADDTLLANASFRQAVQAKR
jgi:hypothetical protein